MKKPEKIVLMFVGLVVFGFFVGILLGYGMVDVNSGEYRSIIVQVDEMRMVNWSTFWKLFKNNTDVSEVRIIIKVNESVDESYRDCFVDWLENNLDSLFGNVTLNCEPEFVVSDVRWFVDGVEVNG